MLLQSFPQSGRVEHDPEEIWESQLQAFKALSLDTSDIAGIGITNQRETTIVWDRKTGKPIYPAIVWQDRRTHEKCAELRKMGLEPLFRERTGLLLDPYFSGTKISWILDHVEGARDMDLAFGTVESWLVWKLTSGRLHITDVTNDSRTLLFNIHTLDWDDTLLDHLGIPRRMLPEVKGSSEVYGETDDGIPICSIIGDQQASLFGQCCFSEGMTKVTYGTGAFMLMNIGKRPLLSQHQLLTTIGWKINDEVEYALEGSLFMAGATIDWLKEKLHLFDEPSKCESLANCATSSEGVMFVPAFTGLGAPHWDPHARGALLGLSRGTTDSHLTRAALEGVALGVSDILECMANETGKTLESIRVDGGMTQNKLFLQIQSDLLGCTIDKPIGKECSALGAAYLAGLACGFWKSKEEIGSLWRNEKRYTPSSDLSHLKKRWEEALGLVKKWGKH